MARPSINPQGTPRRDFIKHMLAGGAASALSLMAAKQNFANVPAGKTLVVIFQRGANDGVNTCVPYGDPFYAAVHRPTIFIPSPDDADTPLEERAWPINSFFGLHPRLVADEQDSTIAIPGSSPTAWFKVPLNGGFKTLWNAGMLAIFPAVNYQGQSLSHFVQQDRIECIPADNRVVTYDGYINRYMQKYQDTMNIQAASIGSGLIKAMRGPAVIPTFFNLAGYQLYNPGSSPFVDPELQSIVDGNLGAGYSQDAPSEKVYGQLLHQFGRKLVSDIALIRQITSDPGIVSDGLVDANRNPVPQYGARYPGTLNSTNGRVNATSANPTTPSAFTTLATQLRDVAHLIRVGKAYPSYNIGLKVACVDHTGGYDTHNAQGRGDLAGRQGRLLYDLSQSITAFLTDLGAFQSDPTKNYAKDVIVVVQTEFGRTVAQNASQGTDHGVGACWFVAGGDINGGLYHDTTKISDPAQGYSLAPANLDQGRYIRRTVVYKDILEDVLRNHLGVSAADIGSIIRRKESDPTEATFKPTGIFG